MTVYISRLALCMGVLFSGALLVIHAQPYDDRTLRELFPDQCAVSCFMNIYVGVTTDQEALNLLKTNGWVKTSSVQLLRLPPSSSRFDDLAHIQWDWDVNRPRSLIINPQLADGNINIRNHVVEGIAFDSTIPAAALYHDLGSPSLLMLAPIHNRDPWLVQWTYQYERAQLNLQMEVRACPYLADVWMQPLHLFINFRPDFQVPTPNKIASPIYLDVVFNAQERRMCRML